MNSLVLKIIAIVAMAIDHVGYFIAPINMHAYIIMRAIGRIAFPIFCFQIAEGYRHTSNQKRYLARLLTAAVISEVPFDLCFHNTFFHWEDLNVMFTLLLGLLSICLYELILNKIRFKLKPLALLPLLALSFAAKVLNTDYGAIGVILIFLLYIVGSPPQGKTHKLMICAVLALFAIQGILIYDIRFHLSAIIAMIKPLNFASRFITVPEAPNYWSYLKALSFASVIPILFYNGKAGKKPKSKASKMILQYSFYLFYPVHMLLIRLVIFITSIIK